jgi:FkbM family methyltransferase
MMKETWSLLSRGVAVLFEQGPVAFVKKTAQFIVSKRGMYIQRVDRVAKKHHLLGVIIVPVYGFLNGFLVVKRGCFFVRYTIFKNIFGKRQISVVDLETINKGEGLEARYFSHDECFIEPSDTVVDIGAARGRSTQIAATKGRRVFGLEPNPRMFACLVKNASQDNVRLFQRAIWSEPGEMELNYGMFAKDASLLTPDSGQSSVSETVRVDSVESFATEIEIDRIDFLKVEAEGAEPEAIDGIGDTEVRKVVVNCSPERDGKSPRSEVVEKLRSKGFEVDSPENGYEVFAWQSA